MLSTYHFLLIDRHFPKHRNHSPNHFFFYHNSFILFFIIISTIKLVVRVIVRFKQLLGARHFLV